MRNTLKHISLFLFAWGRLFFYLGIIVAVIAIPLSLILFFILDFQTAFAISVVTLMAAILFYVSLMSARSNKSIFK